MPFSQKKMAFSKPSVPIIHFILLCQKQQEFCLFLGYSMLSQMKNRVLLCHDYSSSLTLSTWCSSTVAIKPLKRKVLWKKYSRTVIFSLPLASAFISEIAQGQGEDLEEAKEGQEHDQLFQPDHEEDLDLMR